MDHSIKRPKTLISTVSIATTLATTTRGVLLGSKGCRRGVIQLGQPHCLRLPPSGDVTLPNGFASPYRSYVADAALLASWDAALGHGIVLQEAEKTGVILGVVGGCTDAWLKMEATIAARGIGRAPAIPFMAEAHNVPSSLVAMMLRAQGPNIALACGKMSGSMALIHACNMISDVMAPRMIAGGAYANVGIRARSDVGECSPTYKATNVESIVFLLEQMSLYDAGHTANRVMILGYSLLEVHEDNQMEEAIVNAAVDALEDAGISSDKVGLVVLSVPSGISNETYTKLRFGQASLVVVTHSPLEAYEGGLLGLRLVAAAHASLCRGALPAVWLIIDAAEDHVACFAVSRCR